MEIALLKYGSPKQSSTRCTFLNKSKATLAGRALAQARKHFDLTLEGRLEKTHTHTIQINSSSK